MREGVLSSLHHRMQCNTEHRRLRRWARLGTNGHRKWLTSPVEVACVPGSEGEGHCLEKWCTHQRKLACLGGIVEFERSIVTEEGAPGRNGSGAHLWKEFLEEHNTTASTGEWWGLLFSLLGKEKSNSKGRYRRKGNCHKASQLMWHIPWGLLDEVGWTEEEISQEKEILKEQVGQVSMNVAYPVWNTI